MSPVRKFASYVVAVGAVSGLPFFAAQTSGPEDALSAAAAPQVKMYLRVEGECADPLHKGCTEVLSYEQGVDVWGDPHVSEGGSGNDFRTLRAAEISRYFLLGKHFTGPPVPGKIAVLSPM